MACRIFRLKLCRAKGGTLSVYFSERTPLCRRRFLSFFTERDTTSGQTLQGSDVSHGGSGEGGGPSWRPQP